MLSFFRARAGLVWLLMVAMPAICAAPEGILHPGSGTTVDGTMAIEGMHVFSGQLLHTPEGRFSDLLTRGSSLRMLSDTKLMFNGDSAELVTGGVMLNTASQFSVRSGCAEVRPAAGVASRYLVQWLGKTVYVTAQQGDVTVHAGKTARLTMGKTVAVYCGTPKQEIVFVGRDLPAKVIMGAAAAATPIIAISKQELSPPSPSQ